MKYAMTMFPQLLLFACLLFVPGCGSGGNEGSSPTTAVVKLSTVATNGEKIGGVQATLVLPAGVTVQADKISEVVAVTGKAKDAGAQILNTPYYAPATGTITFQVVQSSQGFDAGEFATVNCKLDAGASPKLSDFSIASDYQVTDNNGNDIKDSVSVVLSSVELR